MRVDMSGYRRVNFYELCRLCMADDGLKTNIFKDEGRKRQLTTKIQVCLRLQVAEDDSLPKKICDSCLEKLEGFFDFRSACAKAEGMLESYASALRFNNDFKKEGTIYIKDSYEDPLRLEVASTQLPTQEIHVQLPLSGSPVKVSSSGTKTTASPQGLTASLPIPVSIESLSSLVQATAIHIVQQSHQGGGSHYKIQMEPGVESQASEHNYSYQTAGDAAVTSSPANHKTGSHHLHQHRTNSHNTGVRSMKTASTQMTEEPGGGGERRGRGGGEDDEAGELTGGGGATCITFTSNPSSSEAATAALGQEVLLHFDLPKVKDGHLYPSSSEEGDHRSSMVQMSEFLKMKESDGGGGVEGDGGGLTTDDDGDEKCEAAPSCPTPASAAPVSSAPPPTLSSSEEDQLNQSNPESSEDDKFSTSYICDSCGKLFKRKEHLFQHKKLHTGERPFGCGHCGKTFSRKEHLVRHSVSHTGQKQYSCDLCGKSFGRKDNVRKHRKTHSLSGPFACETCGKQFVVKPYYLMHKATHHGEEVSFTCDVCTKSFTSKQQLTTHRSKHKTTGGRAARAGMGELAAAVSGGDSSPPTGSLSAHQDTFQLVTTTSTSASSQ